MKKNANAESVIVVHQEIVKMNIQKQNVELVNELPFKSEQQSATLSQTKSNQGQLNTDIFRNSSWRFPSDDYISRASEKSKTYLVKARQVMKKTTEVKKPEQSLNLQQDSVECDHLLSLELVEKKYGTNHNHGLKESQVRPLLKEYLKSFYSLS